MGGQRWADRQKCARGLDQPDRIALRPPRAVFSAQRRRQKFAPKYIYTYIFSAPKIGTGASHDFLDPRDTPAPWWWWWQVTGGVEQGTDRGGCVCAERCINRAIYSCIRGAPWTSGGRGDKYTRAEQRERIACGRLRGRAFYSTVTLLGAADPRAHTPPAMWPPEFTTRPSVGRAALRLCLCLSRCGRSISVSRSRGGNSLILAYIYKVSGSRNPPTSVCFLCNGNNNNRPQSATSPPKQQQLQVAPRRPPTHQR